MLSANTYLMAQSCVIQISKESPEAPLPQPSTASDHYPKGP